ncbi:MAG: Hsp70 family protein [Chloroflexales bacterium]|nr:Hsp70 family protein [Chloroflexales bacterium]
MSLIIGIDLGTTYSAAALVRDGTPHILPQGDERIIPSVVGLSQQGAMLIGTPARNQYILYPERTVRSIKRSMGQDVQVTLGERQYTPQEISALILRELKRGAEAQLGQPVERAVITVPAYFSDAARQATREAGEIAGFTVERIINEPTAAALAYGLGREDGERKLVAVYDLGGGTFDVSIIELEGGVVEVRASHGNTQLGGDDFDARLADFLAEGFLQQHSVDPRADPVALARLLRAAEEAKIALSDQPTVRVREEYLLSASGRPLHLDVEVSRPEFEALIADLLDGTIESFDAALRDAGLTADELDQVLFVGGSTRIPLVWELVRDHTGIEPGVAVNPDEVVALGAAVQAAIIAGEPLDAILVDVTPHSLGIEVAEIVYDQVIPDRYNVIIHRNTTIPTTRAEMYYALHPAQTVIEIKIYQGERPVASQNTLLGEFRFEQLRPEAPGQPPRITVKFDLDIDGILHVTAVDRGSGKQAQTSVRAAHIRMTPAEIAGARAALDDFDLVDVDLEEALLAQEAEVGGDEPLPLDVISLLVRARRALADNPGHSELREAAAALEAAAQAHDEEATLAHSEALLDLLYELED